MDYCRVDYKTGYYEYLENDIPIYHQMDSGEQYIDYRNHELLETQYNYQRIKRLKKLPEGKEVKVLYGKRK
jgi:hypothetical protein